MVTCAVPVGDEIFCPCPARSRDTPSFLYNGYRLCFMIVKLRDVALTTHPHLALRLKKEYRYTFIPLWAFLAYSSVNFTFNLHMQLFELNTVVSLMHGTRVTLSFRCCLLPAPATVWQSPIKYFARCVYRFYSAILLSSKYRAMLYWYIFVDRQFRLQSRSSISSTVHIISVSEQIACISVRWLRKF